MKILHVSNRFHPCKGGVEKHIEDLCDNLSILGYESDVACLNKCANSKEKLPCHENYNGINICRVGYLDIKYYKIAPKIIKIVKNYDLVHVHGIGFFLDFLSLTKPIHKKKIVVSTHGGIFHTSNINFFKMNYFRLWCRLIFKNVDRTIAVSRNDYEIFSKITKNIVFIPNGVDIGKIKHNGHKKKFFLYIGRISKNKRIDNLIETMSCLKKLGCDYNLHIAGPDWEGIEKNLKRMTEKNGMENQIIFMGEVNEKKKMECLSSAKFFISSSEYEGFGISVIEAMAAGCVVIVNDIESFRNFVQNGKNGFIVDYSDHKEAAGCIFKILDMKNLAEISKNAVKTAWEYDWKKTIEKMEEVYKEILNKN
jgi:alpha-1,3-mannosyltransferase